MVICIKCCKEQARRTGSACDCAYVGNVKAGLEHAWADRGDFIDELQEKLFPFIRNRIEEWQKRYDEKQALFSERLMSYNKRLEEIQAAYTVYLNVGVPREVEKKKQGAVRTLLLEFIKVIIPVIIVLFVSFNPLWVLFPAL